jgi:hypothetical protein
MPIVDSDNRLEGDLHWFAADADGAPPLAASSVNVSRNALAGRIPELAYPLDLATLDVTANAFICPFPVFPVAPAVVVFRSACVDDWALLSVYACVGMIAALFAALMGVALKRTLDARTFRIVVFAAAWCTVSVALISDALSYAAILRYLVSRPRNCEALNALRLFRPLLHLPREDVPERLRDSAADMKFAAWISSSAWRSTGESDQNQRLRCGWSEASQSMAPIRTIMLNHHSLSTQS